MGSGAEVESTPRRPSINELTRQAYEYLEKEDLQKATELFESAVERSRGTGDPRTQLSCSLSAGTCLVSSGHYQRGLSFLEDASRTANTLVETEERGTSFHGDAKPDHTEAQTLEMSADVFYNMGVASQSLRQYGPAAAHFRRCVELYTRADLKRHAAEGLVGLAECHREAGEVEMEITSLTSAQRLYDELADYGGEADVYVDLSRAYLSLGRKEESKQMLNSARMMCLRVDDPHTRGKPSHCTDAHAAPRSAVTSVTYALTLNTERDLLL